MQVRVLGPVELTNGAARVPLAPRVRALLGTLAANCGQVVSADRLCDAVWGEHQPRHSEAALQTLVSRLRGALRQLPAITITTSPPGYLLRASPAALDSAQFLDLIAAARDAPPRAAVKQLRAALGLWRGDAFAGMEDLPCVQPAAAHLAQVRSTAEEDLTEHLITLGRYPEAITDAERIAAAEPLRERRQLLLMTALWGAGRQADSLAAYARYRRLLVTELGLEPGEAARQLHQRILHPQVPHTVAPPSGNLPPPRALTGRTDLLAALAEALTCTRLLTLTGPGGVGKTSAALSVAHAAAADFPDGVWLVELAGAATGCDVADLTLTVLGVHRSTSSNPVERLAAYLRPKKLLLVLDNCEDALEGAGALAFSVGRTCARVTIVATSRQPLAVTGERVHPVVPLPTPPLGAAPAAVLDSAAVRMFVEHARTADPQFTVSAETAHAVGELCRRLDGMPLALELAAARVRSMSLTEITERLSARFHFLRSSARIADERHRTLLQVVESSYRALDPVERAAFECLSVFPGTFTRASAHALAPADGQPDEVLRALVDKSLLTVHPGGVAETRFSMLETLRAYGVEQLRTRGDLEATRQRHAMHVLQTTTVLAAGVRGPAGTECLDRLDASLSDLRAAVGWAVTHNTALATGLVAALFDYADIRMVPEVFTWAERLIDAATDPTDSHMSAVYAVAAGGARFRGELQRAVELAERGLGMASDTAGALLPLYILGEVALFEGRFEDIRLLSARLLEVANEPDGRTRYHARGLLVLADAYAGSATAVADADALATELAGRSDADTEAWATYTQGEVRVVSEPAAARRYLRRSLRQARLLRDKYLAGVTLVSLASVCVRTGRAIEAAGLFREALEHWRQTGDWTHQLTNIRNCVEALAVAGNAADAAVLYGAVTTPGRAGLLFGSDADRLSSLQVTLLAVLGAAAFDDAVDDGALLNEAELVDYTLAALRRVESAVNTH